MENKKGAMETFLEGIDMEQRERNIHRGDG